MAARSRSTRRTRTRSTRRRRTPAAWTRSASDLHAFGARWRRTPRAGAAPVQPGVPAPTARSAASSRRLHRGATSSCRKALLVLRRQRPPRRCSWTWIEAFVERYEREQRELEIELTTAIAIDDAKADELGKRLEEATGQDGHHRRAASTPRSSAASSCACATASSTRPCAAGSRRCACSLRTARLAPASFLRPPRVSVEAPPDEIASILQGADREATR